MNLKAVNTIAPPGHLRAFVRRIVSAAVDHLRQERSFSWAPTIIFNTPTVSGLMVYPGTAVMAEALWYRYAGKVLRSLAVNLYAVGYLSMDGLTPVGPTYILNVVAADDQGAIDASRHLLHQDEKGQFDCVEPVLVSAEELALLKGQTLLQPQRDPELEEGLAWFKEEFLLVGESNAQKL